MLGTVLIPALPTELLAKIIEHAVQPACSDFLQPDWAADVSTSFLCTLSLTSRTFNQLVAPLLYRHLVLRTPKAGRALVGTLQSDKWNVGEWQGKAARWVKQVHFGAQTKGLTEGRSLWVEEVLDELKGAELERVAVVGLRLGTDCFLLLKRTDRGG